MDRYKEATRISDRVRKDCLNMAQLKSNFDIEKFTVRSEGMFIAHNFHFLMRQYSLAIYELKRLLLDVEENDRKIAEYEKIRSEKSGWAKIEVLTEHGKDMKYVDIEIARLKNQNELHELSIMNKSKMVEHFEKARLHLIELNEGEITNEQYQAEMPEYWKWFLMRKAVWQVRQRFTGISEGVSENIDHLEQPPLLTEEFRVLMLDDMFGGNGKLNIEGMERFVELEKGIPGRTAKLLKK